MKTDIPRTYLLQPGPIDRIYTLIKDMPVEVKEQEGGHIPLVLMSYRFRCGVPSIEVSGADIDSAGLELLRVLAERYRDLVEITSGLLRLHKPQESAMQQELSDFIERNIKRKTPELSGIL